MGARRRHTQRTGLHARGNEMKAYQIMNRDAEWITRVRTVLDCDYAIRPATDPADWWESEVLVDGALNASRCMAEAIK